MITRRTGPAAGLLTMLWTSAAGAMPGAMPWDHAGGPGRPDCTACHFDTRAVTGSPALRLSGFPERVAPGSSHELTLRLETEPLESAGFLLRAMATDSEGAEIPVGQFSPVGADTESGVSAIRSTEAGSAPIGPGLAEWRFSWTAPQDGIGKVTFYVAAIAGNDDQSPLGDRVHLQQVEGSVEPDE